MDSLRDAASTRPVHTPAPISRAAREAMEQRRGISVGDVDEKQQQAQSDEVTPAFLLKWTDFETHRIPINNGDAVELASLIQNNGSSSARHLFVFRGSPTDYGATLREMVGIDAAFMEVHFGRRCYRPLKQIKASWAHFDYPELVCQISNIGGRATQGVPNPGSSGDGAVFCRVSLWLSEKAQILFLDRPAWADPDLGITKRRHKAYTRELMPDENGISMVMVQIDAAGNQTVLGHEAPDLEALLCDNVQDICSNQEDLLELVENLALNKWGEFFEFSDTDLSINSADTTTLLSQSLNSLERNLDVSRQRDKMTRRSANASRHLHSTVAEWEALLSRLGRRVQLSSHICPAAARADVPSRTPSLGTNEADAMGVQSVDPQPYNNQKPKFSEDSDYDTGGPGMFNTSRGQTNENQRSLNRVAYLGGILLPFSIVSGILAIEEPFGPGDGQFWIFWAVTVPLVLITLLVIYADSIRKSEVWIEVASASGMTYTSSEVNMGASPGKWTQSAPDVEQALPVSMPVPISERISEPVAFSLVDDVASVRPGMAKTSQSKMRWRKEELGWAGAFATMFRLYKPRTNVPREHRHL
ncbi:hypothetical protein F4808DRAFT_435025 [Astrocystis sublimbata]|nr:hypothetical protein F4808DRAFT_435025 [Astrocystis sublimbata]